MKTFSAHAVGEAGRHPCGTEEENLVTRSSSYSVVIGKHVNSGLLCKSACMCVCVYGEGCVVCASVCKCRCVYVQMYMWLKTLAAFVEGLGSVPSTHMAQHSVTLVARDLMPSFGLCRLLYMQGKTNIHKINL